MPKLRKNARIIRPYLCFLMITGNTVGWWELFWSACIPNLFKNRSLQTGRCEIL